MCSIRSAISSPQVYQKSVLQKKNGQHSHDFGSRHSEIIPEKKVTFPPWRATEGNGQTQAREDGGTAAASDKRSQRSESRHNKRWTTIGSEERTKKVKTEKQKKKCLICGFKTNHRKTSGLLNTAYWYLTRGVSLHSCPCPPD